MRIRTKESQQTVRHSNTDGRMHYILRNQIMHKEQEKERKESSAEANATNSVSDTGKRTVSELNFKIKRYADTKLTKKREIKAEELNNSRNTNNSVNTNRFNNQSSFASFKRTPTDKNYVLNNNKNSTMAKKMKETAQYSSNLFIRTIQKAENFMISAFNVVKNTSLSVGNILIVTIVGICLIIVITIGGTFAQGGETLDVPNFFNIPAYVILNPYAHAGLYGQCTWFAWGRFYELYGYSPGFTGDGWDCVEQLINAHPDQWELSEEPSNLCIFSGVGNNHVGIVVSVNDDMLTIQEGNLDGITNTFSEAIEDWQEITLSLDELYERNEGIIFAIPILK